MSSGLSVPAEVLETVLNSSSLVLYAVALWIFYKALEPMLERFQELFLEFIPEDKRKEFDASIQNKLQKWANQIPNTMREVTFSFLLKVDRIYEFSFMLPVNPFGIRRVKFFQFRPFFVSCGASYLYLVVGLLMFSYSQITENMIWQMLFLVIFYSFNLYWVRGNESDVTASLVLSVGFIWIGVVAAVAVSVAEVVVIAISGAMVWSGVLALTLTLDRIVAGAWRSAVLIAMGGIVMIFFVVSIIISHPMIEEKYSFFSGNILDLFILTSQIDHGISTDQVVAVFTLFFILFPLLNAFLDWCSVAVTRYEFQRLVQEKNPRIFFFLKIIGWDLLIAVFFKLLVLFTLYVSAHLFEGSGAVFQIETIRNYWAILFPLSEQFAIANLPQLWGTPDYRLISFMIGTTLIPSLIHLGWMTLSLSSFFIGSAMRGFSFLFLGNARFFAFVMSLGLTAALFGVVSAFWNP